MIYAFTVALFAVIAVMPLLIRYSPNMRLVDIPKDNRRAHKAPIPRSGGIAIAVGIFLTSFMFIEMTALMQSILIGALLIVVFGVMDDVLDLDYRWKFFGQIIAVACVLYNGVIFSKFPFVEGEVEPNIFVYAVSGIFLLGVTNAVNLTDGLDGLAGGSTLLTMTLIAILAAMVEQSNVALLAVVVIGSILGFLRFNTYPARIFMGDCGSQLLGFLAGCLAIVVVHSEDSALAPMLSILLVGLPILDTLTVMTIRLSEGRSPFSPDRNHLHHQIMARGFFQYEAVAIIYVLQVFLLMISYFSRYETDFLHIVFYFLFSASILGILFTLKKSGWQCRKAISEKESNRRNYLLRRMEWLYRNTANIVESLLVIMLVGITAALLIYYQETVEAKYLLFLSAVFAVVLLWRYPHWQLRAAVYPAVFVLMYQFSINASAELQAYLTIYDVIVVAVLVLAIRITRREHFRLDTQDLLVLAAIIILPMLPFDELSRYALDKMVLRIAIVLYACEFIIGRDILKRRWLLVLSSLSSLFFIGI